MDRADVAAIITALERWLRNDVAPVLASGANCKLVINIAPGGDVRTVIEKHATLDRGRVTTQE